MGGEGHDTQHSNTNGYSLERQMVTDGRKFKTVFGELWKARSPGGRPCVVRRVAEVSKEGVEAFKAGLAGVGDVKFVLKPVEVMYNEATRVLMLEYEYLERVERDPAEVISILVDHLKTLHTMGICHGHLKASNVIPTAHEIHLADFGLPLIEVASDWAGKGLSRDSLYPYYLPPEGGGLPTVQGDLWGLGICVYEVLKGEGCYPLLKFKPCVASILVREYQPPPPVVMLKGAHPLYIDLCTACLRTSGHHPNSLSDLPTKHLSSSLCHLLSEAVTTSLPPSHPLASDILTCLSVFDAQDATILEQLVMYMAANNQEIKEKEVSADMLKAHIHKKYARTAV